MNIGTIVVNKSGGTERCQVVNTFGSDAVVLRSLEYHSLADFVAQISALQELIPYKPSWSDAPKWATYLGMDKSGMWNWYENIPTKFEDAYVPNGGRSIAAGYSLYWENSLEGRKEEQDVQVEDKLRDEIEKLTNENQELTEALEKASMIIASLCPDIVEIAKEMLANELTKDILASKKEESCK